MCNRNTNESNVAPAETNTFKNIPPCPEDPNRAHYDKWSETREGMLNENGRPDQNRIVRSFRNGRYQHIMFLGICGFVICNHCDKEIILFDPWPSNHSEWTKLVPFASRRVLAPGDDPDVTQSTQVQARQRLAYLASFLREAVDNNTGYKLSGILLSHMHFDHTEDIVLLLELLAAEEIPSGEYTHYDSRNRGYNLSGPPIPVNQLPKICCDFDTMFYLLTYYFHADYNRIFSKTEINPENYWYGNRKLRRAIHDQYAWASALSRDTPLIEKWEEIRSRYFFIPGVEVADNECWLEINVRGSRLHYDDSYNLRFTEQGRCYAGQQCEFFTLDNFLIIPYVWDHMNGGAYKRSQRAIHNQASGHLQRTSAFMIYHKSPNVIGAKRTFILGSMGEMSTRYTQALVYNLPNIETDLLIMAVTKIHPGYSMWYDRERDDALSFLTQHITVKDAVIFDHFEEFIYQVADTAKYLENFRETFLNENMFGEYAYDRDHYRPRLLRDLRERVNSENSNHSNEDSYAQIRRECYNRLFERNRFYVLTRHGFEITGNNFPRNPLEFRDQPNVYYPAFRGSTEPQWPGQRRR